MNQGLVNGMPPSDMNGVFMNPQMGQSGKGKGSDGQSGKGKGSDGKNGKGKGSSASQQQQGQKGAGNYQQQPQDGNGWQSWFQDEISPASPRVLSSTRQRPGPGFGRHPWQEEEGAGKGWDAPWEEKPGRGGHRFHHHWDHWKETHAGEVKVEFMCMK